MGSSNPGQSTYPAALDNPAPTNTAALSLAHSLANFEMNVAESIVMTCDAAMVRRMSAKSTGRGFADEQKAKLGALTSPPGSQNCRCRASRLDIPASLHAAVFLT